MFIELIDLLRCTRLHEDSWLVATFYEMRDRKIIEGLLSCPVCRARYTITSGTAYFDVEPPASIEAEVETEADAIRVAAYLNLVEPGVVVLHGEWGGAAGGLASLGNTVIVLNSDASDERVSRVESSGGLPVARESIDGIALGAAGDELVRSAALAVKNGARMVAPVSAKIPDALSQLARDDRCWVAVKEGTKVSAPVQIARRN